LAGDEGIFDKLLLKILKNNYVSMKIKSKQRMDYVSLVLRGPVEIEDSAILLFDSIKILKQVRRAVD
jgi:hypothetical protein